MSFLILGLILFFGPHLFSAFRSRDAELDIKRKLGMGTYMGLYSLVTAVGLGLIIWGYKLAGPSAYLFGGMPMAINATPYLMAAAVILMTATYVPAGRIKHMAKHPMLLSVCLWAIAHLIDGADLRQILLFGSFLLFSVVDVFAVSARSTNSPSTAVPAIKNDVIVLAVAALAYWVIIRWLHA